MTAGFWEVTHDRRCGALCLVFKGQEVEGDTGRLSRFVCSYQFALRGVPKDEDIIYTVWLNKTTINRPEFI